MCTTGHVNLNHMVTVVSARILHRKITIFPLVITEYLGRDALNCENVLFIFNLSPNFNTYQWILSVAVITMMF